MGRAKPVSRLGQTLTANQPGVVPAGTTTCTPPPGLPGLRYAATGYVAHERILGRAYGGF